MGVADRWKDWDEPQRQGGVRFRAPRLTSAVRLLLFINVGLFLALWIIPKFFGAQASQASQWFVSVFGFFPGEWSAPYLPVWQFLTYGVLHDPSSLGHLFWNMVLLYFFGTMLEGMLGKSRFLAAYVCCMVAGACLHLLAYSLGWAMNQPAIGASGAVLGVLVACAVYRPNQLLFIVKLKYFAAFYVFIDIFWAIEGMSGAASMTAHWIHLGGAGFGFIGARMGWLQLDHLARFQARRAIQTEERRKDDAEVVDRLLEKISNEGIGSLDDKEKDALKRASARKKG